MRNYLCYRSQYSFLKHEQLLANQFRALEEDEVLFLDSLRDEEHRQELKRKQEDAEELKGFKE